MEEQVKMNGFTTKAEPGSMPEITEERQFLNGRGAAQVEPSAAEGTSALSEGVLDDTGTDGVASIPQSEADGRPPLEIAGSDGDGGGPASFVGTMVGPPSPLTGCYLLIILGEPHSEEHKDNILQHLLKGN